MIVIVDYGMGNLHSVKRALQHAAPDAHVLISNQATDIANAQRLVLPGQGAMRDCMQALNGSGLRDALLHALLVDKKPTLGICIGMQMLFEYSEESDVPGLGIFAGGIHRLPNQIPSNIHQISVADIDVEVELNVTDEAPLEYLQQKVPHMGWNNVVFEARHQHAAHPLLTGLPTHGQFYFVHSYYLPLNATLGFSRTLYGIEFSSAIIHNHIVATQFHPEKSGELGLQFCKNFMNWQPA